MKLMPIVFELRTFSSGGLRRLTAHFAALLALIAASSLASAAQDLALVSEGVASPNAELRRSALFQIVNLRSQAASRIAMPALSDPDELVRATAATAVIFLPPAEAVTVLSPMLADKAEFVRREAAFALGEVGDPTATAALVALLKGDKRSIVSSAAAAALGKAGDASAVEALTAVLKKKPRSSDEYIRRVAARSIGQIAEAFRGGRRQRSTPSDFLPEKYKSTVLAASTPASSPEFRIAVTVLLKVASNPKETDDTRREAAFALGGIGDRAAEVFLKANLTNKDTYLAEICREALLKLSTSQ